MSIRSIRPRQSPLFSSYRPRRPSPLIIAWTVSADTRLICKRKTNARNASATDRPNWTGPDWTNLFRDEKKKKRNSLDDLSFFFSFSLSFFFFFVHYARGRIFLFNFLGFHGNREWRLICIILASLFVRNELIISISRISRAAVDRRVSQSGKNNRHRKLFPITPCVWHPIVSSHLFNP